MKNISCSCCWQNGDTGLTCTCTVCHSQVKIIHPQSLEQMTPGVGKIHQPMPYKLDPCEQCEEWKAKYEVMRGIAIDLWEAEYRAFVTREDAVMNVEAEALRRRDGKRNG
jgi:hypothetical protein